MGRWKTVQFGTVLQNNAGRLKESRCVVQVRCFGGQWVCAMRGSPFSRRFSVCQRQLRPQQSRTEDDRRYRIKNNIHRGEPTNTAIAAVEAGLAWVVF
jgi:hypothetical protein